MSPFSPLFFLYFSFTYTLNPTKTKWNGVNTSLSTRHPKIWRWHCHRDQKEEWMGHLTMSHQCIEQSLGTHKWAYYHVWELGFSYGLGWIEEVHFNWRYPLYRTHSPQIWIEGNLNSIWEWTWPCTKNLNATCFHIDQFLLMTMIDYWIKHKSKCTCYDWTTLGSLIMSTDIGWLY